MKIPGSPCVKCNLFTECLKKKIESWEGSERRKLWKSIEIIFLSTHSERKSLLINLLQGWRKLWKFGVAAATPATLVPPALFYEINLLRHVSKILIRKLFILWDNWLNKHAFNIDFDQKLWYRGFSSKMVRLIIYTMYNS